MLNPTPLPPVDYPLRNFLPIPRWLSAGVDTFADMGKPPLVGVALGVACLAGCAAAPVVPSSATTTVTASPTSETAPTSRTATATVTATRTATVTATPTVAPELTVPRDVTDEFKGKAALAGLARSQLDQVVAVSQQGSSAQVLTTMRRPFGGWDCVGTPDMLNGVRLRFVSILYEDRGVFRDCQL